MKHFLIVIFSFASLLAAEDSLTFKIKGGRPLPGINTPDVPPQVITGKEFEKLRPEVEKIIKLLGNQTVWTDLGPDARYMSAEIKLGDKVYNINSWQPLHMDSPKFAVSEKRGLVSVSSEEEKKKIESENSEKYRAILSIFQHARLVEPQIEETGKK